MHTHLLNILATWRLTELLVEERGFYAIFDKVREYAVNKTLIPHTQYDQSGVARSAIYEKQNGFWNEVSQMLNCRHCTSVTVGIALAIVTRQNVLYGFAYSAASLMFGRIFEKIEA